MMLSDLFTEKQLRKTITVIKESKTRKVQTNYLLLAELLIPKKQKQYGGQGLRPRLSRVSVSVLMSVLADPFSTVVFKHIFKPYGNKYYFEFLTNS